MLLPLLRWISPPASATTLPEPGSRAGQNTAEVADKDVATGAEADVTCIGHYVTGVDIEIAAGDDPDVPWRQRQRSPHSG